MKELLLLCFLFVNVDCFCQDTLNKHQRDSLLQKVDSFYKANPQFSLFRPYRMTILRKPTKEDRDRIKSRLSIEKIDSIVNAIDRIEYFYEADSIVNVYDKDSNVLSSSSIKFFYADRKAKKLLKVDELSITDTSSTVYYYAGKQLIKIENHISHDGKISVLELFYNKEKLIDERRKGDLVVQVFDPILYDRARKFLKYKPKAVSPNWIGRSKGPEPVIERRVNTSV